MATKAIDGKRTATSTHKAIWTGSLQLGLVNVPVRMFGAIEEHRLRFHQVHDQDGARIREEHVCTVDGAHVSHAHIAKGFALGDGRYVIVSPKELEAFASATAKTIDIEELVDAAEINPVYYKSAYHLVPDEGAERAYALLHAAMERTHKVGLARIVLRTHPHLAAIRPSGGALSLFTMHYADEIVPLAELGVLPGADERPRDHDLELAEELIASRSGRFRPERYRDEHRDRILAYLERKAQSVAALPPAAPRSPEALALTEALRASLAAPPERASANAAAPAPERRPARAGGRARPPRRAA